MTVTMEGIHHYQEENNKINIQLYFIKKLMEISENQSKALDEFVSLKDDNVGKIIDIQA